MNLNFRKVFQFKISLKEIRPTIWRRIQVPGNYSFWDFHVAIQDAMGWQDYHLHAFRIFNPRLEKVEEIGIPDENWELETLPGWEYFISDYFSFENAKADYEYDFGDSWEHEILLEEIFPKEKNKKYPRSIAGERACPPEDCGGFPGYQHFLEAISDPGHPEREDFLMWVGGSFESDRFDPQKIRFDDPKKRWRIAFSER